ncbi:hypothetical protein ACIBKY_51370 [Nonomuraea sp. NPDC050394]|uniref:hypothetical protein n=1 Tax=Nonomuraea sp. NPDC050394 TaxID=3364363 RepID=UPI0037AACB90
MSASKKPAQDPAKAVLFQEPGVPDSPPAKAPSSPRDKKPIPPRRLKGVTTRYPFTVRLAPEVNDRLTLACQKLGIGPQGALEQALTEWFDKNGIPDDLRLAPPGKRPARPRTLKPRTYRKGEGKDETEEPSITVRLLPLTDARLTYACLNLPMGPKDLVDNVLKVFFMRHQIPRP